MCWRRCSGVEVVLKTDFFADTASFLLFGLTGNYVCVDGNEFIKSFNKLNLYYNVTRITFAPMNAVLNIRIDEATKKKLQAMADKEQRKLSDYIRLQLEKLANKGK